ncbi:MAG: type II and III secretion system protein family protein, partial [Hyphomicrobiaceae bacterium]
FGPSQAIGAEPVTLGQVAQDWSSTGEARQTSVVVNKSRVLRVSEAFAETLIANDKIADIVPITDHSIYVVGKAIGTTSLAILNDRKQVIDVFDIAVTHDVSALENKLADTIPYSNIRVNTANGRIVLTGTVPDALGAKNAMAIAEQYVPKSVTSAMTVRSSQQVLLEVRFIEASRTASRELGLGFRTRGDGVDTNFGGQAVVDNAGNLLTTTLLSGAQPFGTALARLLERGTRADVIVRALEERGLARRLAEPNLVTLSGEPANFLAGGEFPFPIDTGNNQVTVQFKKFGVALEFTPTVLGDGLINLKIAPEVSELDPNGGVQLNNIVIPGIVVRRASTSVELRDGQSFAVAGLLQNNNVRNRAQLPWIGQVPVLGALFRSAEYNKRETDLVIIVTPRLVRPAVTGERLAAPTDVVPPGNDADFFLRGNDELPSRNTRRTRVAAREPKPFGHILQLSGRGE